MWQFWQRGCWNTCRTVSNAARPEVTSAGGAAPSRAAAASTRTRAMVPMPRARMSIPPPQASRSGSRRRRLPVAAKTAFATAGAIGGTPGSPTPLGRSVLETMCTSTLGASCMRTGG